MDATELTELVRRLRAIGSDLTDVEVKRAEGGLPRSLRETLSAFSNTAGGTVILGLDEASGFSATGLHDPAAMADNFASMCSTELEPPVRAITNVVEFEGVHLLVAEIPEIDASLKPCYYRGQGMNSGSYVRVNDGDHRLTPYEVQTLVANRGQPLEDTAPLTNLTLDELDEQLVESFYARLRRSRPHAFASLAREDALIRSRAVSRTEQGLVPTLGGLLALGKYPQEHYPQLAATLVVYPTDDGPDVASGTRFLDNVTLEGPLPVIAADALTAIRRNMKRRSTVDGIGRTESWEYPEAALREAIVNALVHRDLSPAARGTQVQIEMYPSKIIVRNPGGLFGPVSVDDLADDGTSSSRNSFLLKMLEDITLPGDPRTVCENRGSGIRTMVESLRAAGMSVPRFEDKISSFSVTFPNHTLLDDETVAWIQGLAEQGLTDSQHIGLAMLHKNGTIDNPTYRNATGVDSRVATAELQDLVSRELLEQVGTRRWTEYRLSARSRTAPSEPEHKLPPRDRRKLILDAIENDKLSRAEISGRTGLNKQVVIHWLRILRQEQQVRIVGGESPQSRNVRYERTPDSWGAQTLDLDGL
ncbi:MULTISPECIES: ATP-binding protein [Microbacterium]|uniref:ATP-binding protein n=2 Tax=Microbacterium TaxID=33882 RepID=UPI001D171598|nr:ATP-binding protein [Microbacterium schleiferi]MCC4267015.1 putative DNA binding domain-containing protein [Microbacterium schleiferi]